MCPSPQLATLRLRPHTALQQNVRPNFYCTSHQSKIINTMPAAAPKPAASTGAGRPKGTKVKGAAPTHGMKTRGN